MWLKMSNEDEVYFFSVKEWGVYKTQESAFHGSKNQLNFGVTSSSPIQTAKRKKGEKWNKK